MANFPTANPVFTGFTSTHTLSQDNHAAQHNLEQGEIVALAAKIGTGSSTSINNTVMRGNGVGTSSWSQVDLSTDVTGNLAVANANLVLRAVYPVGSIYINATDSANPSILLGFGTWTAFGAGRVPVGFDNTQTEFDTAEETGGEKNHTLTTSEIPAHVHAITNQPTNLVTTIPDVTTRTDGATTGANTNGRAVNVTGTTDSTGSGSSHNNLQPYITVYMWKRAS